jgi:flagellar motor switch protein FliN
MTEGNQKDKPSENNTGASNEVNVPEDGEQEKNGENAEQRDGDNLEATAVAEAADTQNPLMEEAAKISPAEEKPPKEMQAVEDFDLNLLLDIPLEITVELGRTKVQIQELLNLGPGSTVSLTKLEGEPVDILANDKLIARGEVVLQNKKYGIRITEITSRHEIVFFCPSRPAFLPADNSLTPKSISRYTSTIWVLLLDPANNLQNTILL